MMILKKIIVGSYQIVSKGSYGDCERITIRYFPNMFTLNRIDRNTRGLFCISRNRKDRLVAIKYYRCTIFGNANMIEGMHTILLRKRKFYMCNFLINFSPSGSVRITDIRKVIRRWMVFSIVNIRISGGMTHQIRYHLSTMGYPIVGDRVYGNRILNKIFKAKRMMLFSYKLYMAVPKKKRSKARRKLNKIQYTNRVEISTDIKKLVTRIRKKVNSNRVLQKDSKDMCDG
ncbi:hypothetical protein [Candidatus Vidania fulgoroideorum]